MSDAPPPPDAGGPLVRRALTPAAIESVLADFRGWLEALTTEPTPPAEPDGTTVDLAALVNAFTALRHEVNLQTKATRAQSEQVQRALTALTDIPDNVSLEHDAIRPLLETLVELHDGLTLAERELTAARDALPEPDAVRISAPLPAPTWIDYLLPPLRLQRERRDTKAVMLARAAIHVPLMTSRQRLTAALTGLQMTMRRVERALAKHGLEPVPADDCPFDPETMEVLEALSANGRPPGDVIEVIRRGYRWNGRVFRCAQVRVTK